MNKGILILFLVLTLAHSICSNGCQSCSSPTVCDSCQTGLYLTAAKTCLHCPIGCETCHLAGSQVVCDSCHGDFMFGENWCFQCHPGCTTCSGGPVNCTSCPSGYHLQEIDLVSHQFCLPDSGCMVPFCTQCVASRSEACQSCFPGHAQVHGFCLPCKYPCGSCTFNGDLIYTNVVYPFLANMTMNFNPAIIPPQLSSQVNFTSPDENERDIMIGGFLILQYLMEEKGVTLLQIATQAMSLLQYMATDPHMTAEQYVSLVEQVYSNLTGEAINVDDLVEILITRGSEMLICTGCMPSFYIDPTFAQFCPKCPVGCSLCNHLACTACETGYSINSVGQCAPCTYPCLNCAPNSPTSCLSCHAPYSLAGSQCVVCAEPCLTCTSASPTVCVTCKYPYSLNPASGGVCIRCAQASCNQCSTSDAAVCLDCVPGFSLNSGVCSLCPSNCLECTSAGVCSSCRQGYTVSSGLCASCSLACKSCYSHSSSICNECLPGFYLTQAATCEKCSQNCETCTNAYTCDTYAEGLTIYNDLVVICGKGCKTCQPVNPDICEICKPRFFLSGNVCRRCEEGCIKCSDQNTCLVCGPTYQFQSNNCIKCMGHCRTCQTADPAFCLTCKRGYVLSGGVCSKSCQKGCRDCSESDPNVCYDCLENYALDSAGRCVRCLSSCSTCDSTDATQCISCVKGFYVNSNACSRCPKGCSQCTESECLSCFPGFSLATISNQVVCSKKCKFPCATCTTDASSCATCRPGYTLSNGLCSIDLTCSSGSSCTYCTPGSYEISAGVCQPCSSDCSTCTSTSACEQCFDGFYQSGGACLPCDPSCSICVDSTICEVCADGFVFEIVASSTTETEYSDKCIACESNCQTCMMDPSICTSCPSGMRLKSTRCHSRHTLKFIFEIDVELATFLSNASQQDFIEALSTLLGIDVEDIILDLINHGSSVVVGTISATSSSEAVEYSNTISNSSDSLGFPLISSSLSVQYDDQPLTSDSQDEEEESSSKSNVGVIVGAVIGGIVFISVIVVIAVYTLKRNKKYSPNNKIDNESEITEQNAGQNENKHKEERTQNQILQIVV